MAQFEITAIVKKGGALTKRIGLGAGGKLVSDGSACVMSRGKARRIELSSAEQLADLIVGLGSNEALTLGVLRPDLPDEVEVVTKSKLNGAADVIARTRDFIGFCPGKPTFVLLDLDTKGMPTEVRQRVEALGGFWPALTSVLPELEGVARVERRSTSAGLYRTDTDEPIAGSDGQHVYLLVQDGADGERFLKWLHDCCWRAGLGWFRVGRAGQLLERSIVDHLVGSPERLVFEGTPVLDPPLAQDQESRRPVAIEGEALDTRAACPALNAAEEARLRELRANKRDRLAPEAEKARKAFIEQQAAELAKRDGLDLRRARAVVERQCDGVLLPSLELPFDDQEFANCTVADVLADPDRFEGATLADPIEGIVYGRCKAKIMRRADGTLFVHSFAHGGIQYEVKFDFAAAKAALEREDEAGIAELYVRLARLGDFDYDEADLLLRIAAKRAGCNKTALKASHERAAPEPFHDRRRMSGLFKINQHCACQARQSHRPHRRGPALRRWRQ